MLLLAWVGCSGQSSRSISSALSRSAEDTSLTVATRLYDSAVDLEIKGYYRQTLDSLEAALPVFYEHGSTEWVARALLLWSQAASTAGRYGDAIDSLNTLKQLSASLDDDSIETRSTILLANTLIRSGKPQSAIPLLLTISDNQPTNAEAYSAIGHAYYELDAFVEAIHYLELALEAGRNSRIVASLHSSVVRSRTTNNLALAWFNYSNDFQKAKSYLTETARIRNRDLVEGHPLRGEVFGNLGMLMAHAGLYDQAIDYLDRAEIIFSQRDTLNLLQLAICYSNKGMLYGKIGEYDRALDFLSRALDLRLQLFGPHHPRVYYSYSRLANVYGKLGNFTESIRLGRRAAAVWSHFSEHNSVKTARSLLGLSETYLSAGMVDSSEFYSQASKDIIGRSDQSLTADILRSMRIEAKIDVQRGRMQFALNRLNAATALVQQRDSTNRPLLTSLLNDLAELYLSLGDVSSAIEHADKALQNNVVQHDSLLTGKNLGIPYSREEKIRSLMIKSRTVGHQEGSSEAEFIQILSDISATIDAMQKRLQTIESRAFLSQKERPLSQQLVSIGLSLYKRNRDQQLLKRIIQTIESSRASIIRYGADNFLNNDTTRVDQADRKQQQILREKMHFLETQIVLSEARHDELFQARHEYDQFMRHLGIKYPDYYAFRHSVASANADSIIGSLDDTEALIEFFESRDSLYVITLTKSSSNVHSVSIEEIAPLIVDYREAVVAKDDPRYQHSAYRLYELLLDPVRDLIVDKNLIVVPDSLLHFVPLEPLLTSPLPLTDPDWGRFDRMPYLVHRHAIEYAYSATLRKFVKTRTREDPSREFLGVAPAFENVTGTWPNISLSSIAYLPGSLNEVRSIYSMFVPQYDVLGKRWRSRSTFLQGAEATEEELRKLDLGAYRFLHFATHGSVDNESPTISGLLMHRGSSGHDDVFRLGEIYGYNLSSDLVVLSACETGLGQLVAGEGVIGLTGGFLYAGARNVVVSLWPVDDQSASRLMRLFYSHALQHRDYRRALQEAKLDLIENGSRYSRPYHWASYVVFGS